MLVLKLIKDMKKRLTIAFVKADKKMKGKAESLSENHEKVWKGKAHILRLIACLKTNKDISYIIYEKERPTLTSFFLPKEI